MTFPEPENLTTMVDIVQYGNSVTGDFLVNGILAGLYLIIFIYMRLDSSEPTLNVAIYAGFFTTLATIIAKIMDVLPNDKTIFVAIATLIIPVIFSLLSKE